MATDHHVTNKLYSPCLFCLQFSAALLWDTAAFVSVTIGNRWYRAVPGVATDDRGPKRDPAQLSCKRDYDVIVAFVRHASTN